MRYGLIPLVLSAGLLAGCGETPVRFAPPVPTPGAAATVERVGIAYSSVEVLEVSLPSYANSDEIYVREGDGGLRKKSGVLWTDEPSRAMTLELSRTLSQITGRRVAPEPWPFADRAQARVDVRVEEMFADGDTRFVISGQYFVAPEDGGRDRAGVFTLAAPVATDGGPAALAAARGQVVRELAQLIARQGLR
ncbi:membrane integrity-associated transporter subunit PqiC [Pseudooceanicola sp. LIPI14-2-Ac024]|uniref:PqiC family protein n=1 Tax=Pseudooceanicola sp. LIPI14-2-Ac024 TaxID=3344875 RepID=UPI0035CEF67A